MTLFQYMEKRNRLGRLVGACEVTFDKATRKACLHVGMPGEPADVTRARYGTYVCSNWVARMWSKGFLPARKPRKGRFTNSAW